MKSQSYFNKWFSVPAFYDIVIICGYLLMTIKMEEFVNHDSLTECGTISMIFVSNTVYLKHDVSSDLFRS